jgi:hypothetical protein
MPARKAYFQARVHNEPKLHADETSSRDALAARFEPRRINHHKACSFDGASTNWAEGYFSRLRHSEIGNAHHSADSSLPRWAQEAAWREKSRRVDNGIPARRSATPALACEPNVVFSARTISETDEACRIMAAWGTTART